MSRGIILLVEDDDILSAHLRNKLNALGYTVPEPVATGEEAVAVAGKLRPDLIIMDIELAGKMNGIRAAELIRAREDIPIIFLTGYSEDPQITQARETAPYAYLIKPVQERELMAAIELAIYRSRIDHKMRESEERFRKLFEAMTSGSALHEIILDAEGKPCDFRFLEINPAFERIIGLKAENVIGRTMRELSPDVKSPLIEICGQVALTGESAWFENYDDDLGKHFEVTAYSPKQGQFATIFRDITERKKIDEAQMFMMECGSRGDDFFMALVRWLAEHLNMDFVCIARLDPDGLTAHTLAVYSDGQYEETNTFPLKDSPCWKVVLEKTCCYPREVRHHFPENMMLRKLEAESYVGTVLWGSQGMAIGLVSAVGRRPLDSPRLTETILKLAGVRAAGEVERREAEEALANAHRDLDGIFRTLPDLYFCMKWDGTILSYRAGDRTKLYFSPEQFIGKRMQDILPPSINVQFADAIGELEQGETESVFEYTLPLPDGERSFEARCMILDASRIFSFVRDITDRKRVEEEVRESERHLAEIIDFFPDALLGIDSEQRVVIWNHALEQLTGIPASEMLGKGDYVYSMPFYGESRPLLMNTFWDDSHTAAGHYSHFEAEGDIRIIEVFCPALKKGEGAWIWAKATPFRDKDGNLTGAIESIRDYTDRKKADVAVRESEEKYRALVENAQEMIVVVQGSRFVFANPQTTEILGYSNTELITRPFLEFVHPEDRELVGGRYWARVGGESAPNRYAFRAVCKNGGIRWLELNAVRIEWRSRPATLNFLTDVTERHQAAEALHESEERLRLALNGADLGTWDWNVPTGTITVNERWAGMLGYTLDEIRPHLSSWENLTNPDDYPRVMDILNAHLEGKTDVYEAEYRLCHKSGNWVWVLDRGKVIERDAQGNPIRVCGTHLDITERRQAAEALQASEERYRKIIETTHDGVALLTSRGDFVEVNDACCKMIGYSREELLAMSILDVEANENSEYEVHKKMVLDRGSDRFETRLRHKNKKIIDVETSIASISGVDLHGVFFRDITERKRLEQQLHQAQKMETIGRLAGGVAHDFNNILTVINGNAELALMFMQPSDPQYGAFEEIRRSGERAANLTRQLLAFSSKQIIEPKVININQTLLNIDKMLRRLIGENIELVTIPEESLWQVKADPGQVEQVLINLVVNARDAMPEGGKLIIETMNATLDEEYVKNFQETEPGNYVMFAVSDTGIGMSADTRNHLFEPFFTTKPKGTGTGLGLSTCYGIVKQNKGCIFVYSEPFEGTTIKVYLPAIEDTLLNTGAASIRDSVPAGTERVLLVEDDPGIRLMISRHLTASGYQVLVASNGHEALSEIQKLTDPVQLLITDVVMPLMGGWELANQVKILYPGLRILFMSGYTDSSIVNHGILEPGIMFIQKPFSMIDFLRKIRETLEG